MALPDFTMRQLLEAGVHFGHQSHRWNPKMAPYIFGARNNIHIIDLAQTVPLLHQRVAGGQRHRRQGRPHPVRRHQAPGAGRRRRRGQALRAVFRQLALARRHADQLEDDLRLDQAPAAARRDARLGRGHAYTKKERLTLQRERDKLDRSLGGIKDMGGLPDLIFVIDTNKEDIAIQEAQRLNIPVAAIVDTNCDPKGITYVVPGNDDAGRAIALYCDLIARAAIDGISRAQGDSGIDIGASVQPVARDPDGAPAAGFQGLAGPRGTADDLKKLTGRVRRDREEAQRPRHLPLLAARRTRSRHRAQDRRRSRPAEPRRCLGRPGQDADRGSGITQRDGRIAPATSSNQREFLRRTAAGGNGPRRGPSDRQEGRSTMATITAAMVKDLRESTGAGMMDCKAALTENDGDMQAAQDWLRKKGLSKAAKKAGRVAAEGLIGALTAGNKGVVVEVNSETDFVARNGQFQGLVKMIAQVALDVGADVEKIKAAKVGDVTVETAIADAIATIGENMTLRRAASLEVGKGVVSSYVHNAVVDGAGKMGVIVALKSPGKADELRNLGRQLAMHIAAANPLALDPSGLDPAVVKREKDVLADKYRQQGKPENMIEKIVESGPEDLLQGSLPAEQAFIHDTRQVGGPGGEGS